jgi:hypothetical protein
MSRVFVMVTVLLRVMSGVFVMVAVPLCVMYAVLVIFHMRNDSAFRLQRCVFIRRAFLHNYYAVLHNYGFCPTGPLPACNIVSISCSVYLGVMCCGQFQS